MVRHSSALCSLVVATAAAATAGACGDDAATTGGGAAGAGSSASSTIAITGSSAASSAVTTGPLPDAFFVSGLVVDQDGAPVEGAIVMQAGSEPSFLSGPGGTFSIELTSAVPGERVLVAAKVGYRSGGELFEAVPSGPTTLVLREVAPPDNTGYTFGHPGVGDPALDNSTIFCGHCHTTFAAEFNQSGHARATRDREVQDLYAGAAAAHTTAGACAAAGGEWRVGRVPGSPSQTAARCYVGDGALPDLNGCGAPGQLACDDPALPAAQQPTEFGACADCHALGMDGPLGGRDLLEAEGIGYEFGNHCDACHHVRDVDLSLPPGAGGRLVMQRPHEKDGDDPINAPIRQAMFGPYPDVPLEFMGGSYQPKFSTAEFCAGCHEQKQAALVPGSALDPARWPDGLPTHSTFSEWSAGPYNPTTQCQGCHMPPKFGLFNPVDVADASNAGLAFGFGRAPEQIRSHSFRGPTDVVDGMPALLDGAATIDLVASPVAGLLEVTVTVENTFCGHALPTGEPMRAVVLVVRAEGCGQRFSGVAGSTIDDGGGALAEAELGVGASLAGAVVTWPEGAALAQPGARLSIVRPTGVFHDYDGVGPFEGSLLAPSAKGMEILAPVAEVQVSSATATTITLDSAPPAQGGDRVILGDPVPGAFLDGAPSLALAGAAGLTFSRVMVDPGGRRRVPHHRAVDIASDNRLRPLVPQTSSHTFAAAPGCTQADVTAVLLYRALPLGLSRERGWDGRDHVVQQQTTSVALP